MISNTINLLEGIRKIGFTKCIATPHTLPEIWENTSDGIMETFHTTKNNLEEKDEEPG